jgi:fructoselysine-6-P-deglycase FrlB-like protein
LQNEWRPILKEIAQKPFTNVVVLADNVLNGIAEEAALVFTEICLISGKYFNLLDYRHGPIVLNNESTLTIMTMQPGETKLQSDLLNDIKARGGITVVVRPAHTDFEGTVTLDCNFSFFPSYGIALICAVQIIALEKALASGINPDEPDGLSAWILL